MNETRQELRAALHSAFAGICGSDDRDIPILADAIEGIIEGAIQAHLRSAPHLNSDEIAADQARRARLRA